MINLGDEYIYCGEVTTVSLITPTGMVRLKGDSMRSLFKPWTNTYDVLIGSRQSASGSRARARKGVANRKPRRARAGVGESLGPAETRPEKAPTDAE